jgi:hypothetical protein
MFLFINFPKGGRQKISLLKRILHLKKVENPCYKEYDYKMIFFQSNDDLNGTSDLDSEIASENDEEVPADEQNQTNPDLSPKKQSENNNASPKRDLETSHREILEKLKRQENDEGDSKDGIDGLSRKRKLSGDEDADDEDRESSGKRSPSIGRMEIKTQRPMGLLAQHGLTTKSHMGLNLSTTGHSHPHHHSNNNNTSNTDKDSMDNSDLSPGIKSERGDSSFERERAMSAGLIPPLDFTHPAFLDRQFSMHGPHSPPDIGLIPGDGLGTPTGGHHWTFEEQFKQVRYHIYMESIYLFI